METGLLDLPGFSMRDGIVVRSAERDTVPYAVFESKVPTATDAQKILDWGYGLHLLQLPERHLDLEFLVAFSDQIEYLSIADGRCEDVSRILSFQRLMELELNVNQKSEIPISKLSALTRFAGPLRGFADIVACRNLRSLALQRVRDGVLGAIIGPVENLELVDLQNLSALPQLEQPASLSQAYLVGVGELDLSTIRSLSSLQTVGFDGCRLLSSVDTLLSLTALTGLSFASCREIRPLESLLELEGVAVSVLRKNPFTSEFRKAAVKSRSEWTYHGAPTPK